MHQNVHRFNKSQQNMILILIFDCCRYIEYMCDMMAEEPIIPHSKPIIIRSIIMTPVPLFNKQRNGCRPFCEVYVGDERVLTTSQEYDKMKWVDTRTRTPFRSETMWLFQLFILSLIPWLFPEILRWRMGEQRFPSMWQSKEMYWWWYIMQDQHWEDVYRPRHVYNLYLISFKMDIRKWWTKHSF